ncbi:MAG: hypothetical protein M1814_004080 [Vezdaea aestivalis]|nr:MAG: hypothetical protein M1814_004080 [Vezdaea aestivalis]
MDTPRSPPTSPEIPERRHRISTSITTQSRRKSIPPVTDEVASTSANHVTLGPASPEVISSLISSLSSLSTPVQDHFDNVPSVGSRPLSTSSATLQNAFANFDEASRQASPPTTPRAASFVTAPSSLKTGRNADSISVRSKDARDFDEVSSIGSLSIEPGVPKDQSNRNSVGSDSRQSRRSAKSLMFMSSKERLKEKDGDRRRNGDGLGLDAVGDNMSQLSTERIPSTHTISEEPLITDRPPFKGSNSPSATVSSLSGTGSPVVAGGSSPVLPHARLIPTRDSSLRGARSPSQKKRNSYQSSRRSSRQESTLGTTEEEGGRPRNGSGDGAQSMKSVDATIDDQETPRPRKTKHYPPAIITSEPPMKLSSPLSSPALTGPKSPRMQQTNGAQPMTSMALPPTKVQQTVAGTDDESAPSPAIVQRRPRDIEPRAISFTGRPKPPKYPSVTDRSPSLDILPGTVLSTPPQRTSSRLKRVSLPTSPSSDKHRRLASTPIQPIGRHSESSAARPSASAIDERPSSADSIDDAVEAYTCSPRLSQKIRHPQSGRTISFSEVGDSQGFAVFCCVGMGLTRYITAFYDELAQTLKLRLITPDRPGIGDSDAYTDGTKTPLGWPDDVYAICQALKITKFSILAHSAGAIYALATALRMGQHIRGRIHLLAPWIPPSQLSSINSTQDPVPSNAVPTSQRILRALPTPFLKAANSSFMSATSSSITSSLPKSPRRSSKTKRSPSTALGRETPAPPPDPTRRDSLPYDSPTSHASQALNAPDSDAAILAAALLSQAEKERQSTYDSRLTAAIWQLATTGANPAVDLLVCLERRAPIGFRYVDITRAVVIHHGSKDSRVPVENVRWLGKAMRRCEVRVLEGEGHGLMASAKVMAGVLMEVAKEWEDWMRVVNGGSEGRGSRVDLRGVSPAPGGRS